MPYVALVAAKQIPVHTYFVEHIGVYLTFLKINFSTVLVGKIFSLQREPDKKQVLPYSFKSPIFFKRLILLQNSAFNIY